MRNSGSGRLRFVVGTPLHLRAELEGQYAIGAALGASVPPDWPPGEYDRDAIEFMLGKLGEGGDAVVGWYVWYALLQAQPAALPILVAAGGYFGPPDASRMVEIGFSVSSDWRNKGIATELVRALVGRAADHRSVRVVQAHARPDNAASIAVLRKCGFTATMSADPELLRFELAIANS